jgi:hypothetical protein
MRNLVADEDAVAVVEIRDEVSPSQSAAFPHDDADAGDQRIARTTARPILRLRLLIGLPPWAPGRVPAARRFTGRGTKTGLGAGASGTTPEGLAEPHPAVARFRSTLRIAARAWSGIPGGPHCRSPGFPEIASGRVRLGSPPCPVRG